MKKSVFKRIGGFVTSFLAILIVIICIALIFTKSSNDIMFFGDYACMYVVSPSMTPEIPTRTFIFIEKVDTKELQVGDVITFISDDPSIKGEFNTHRIVEIKGDNEEFVTKGDYNASEDAYTAKAENVQGRYVKKAEVLTAFAAWFLKPSGLAITIVAIILICCAVYVPDIVKNAKLSAAEKDEKLKEVEIERIKKEALEEAKVKLDEMNKEAEEQKKAAEKAAQKVQKTANQKPHKKGKNKHRKKTK